MPFGVLVLLTGALTLIFGCQETSDFWVDALQMWWRGARRQWRRIKRLVIYLDNGPHNGGHRTQFLKRLVQFADWSVMNDSYTSRPTTIRFPDLA